MSLLKVAALMGVSRMIPMAVKALTKKAPVVARSFSGGSGIAAQMRQSAKAPARPISPTVRPPGVKPPVNPNSPANIHRSMPLVRPSNMNSAFDTSPLWDLPKKMASIRATPIAKMISSLSSRHVQF